MLRLTGRLLGLALAGLLWSGSARADEAARPQAFALTYDVYLGGLHIFSFDADVELQGGGYRVRADGLTRGIIGVLYSWDIKLTADGVDQDGRIAAARYATDSAFKGRRRNVDLAFRDAGRYDLSIAPPLDPDPDIEGGLPDSLPAGTLDPLSMAIAASRAIDETGRCDQTLPVFDGQRRYDLTLSHGTTESLPASDYAIYQGATLRCRVSIARLSGFRKSQGYTHQMDAGSQTPPSVWMAKVRDDLPPVPVRYEGASALGTMVVHLSAVQVRIRPVASEH